MGGSPSQAQASRPCAYCGKPVLMRLNRCPHCREEQPQVRLTLRGGSDGRRQIRRGLLYMLLGAVIYYFTSEYSALVLPYNLNPVVNEYLAPAIFLGGLGMSLYGIYLRMRS